MPEEYKFKKQENPENLNEPFIHLSQNQVITNEKRYWTMQQRQSISKNLVQEGSKLFIFL